MMILSFKKGKNNKIHISIDGEYKLTVDESYFLSFGYKNGCEIDEKELNILTEEINQRRAFNKACDLLSRREHSEKELMEKLRQKGFEEGSAQAIKKLKEYGYINDESFARNFTEELIRIKGYGKRRIEQELYKKGIDRNIIFDVMEETEFDNNKIISIINRKYLRGLDTEKGKKRAVSGLMRMGYSYSEIRSALKEAEETDLSEVLYD